MRQLFFPVLMAVLLAIGLLVFRGGPDPVDVPMAAPAPQEPGARPAPPRPERFARIPPPIRPRPRPERPEPVDTASAPATEVAPDVEPAEPAPAPDPAPPVPDQAATIAPPDPAPAPVPLPSIETLLTAESLDVETLTRAIAESSLGTAQKTALTAAIQAAATPEAQDALLSQLRVALGL